MKMFPIVYEHLQVIEIYFSSLLLNGEEHFYLCTQRAGNLKAINQTTKYKATNILSLYLNSSFYTLILRWA